MNQSFRVRQGLDVVVGGVPKQIIGSAQSVRSVSLLGTDYPGLTLRPHVKVGTVVAAGEPVLVDRHQPVGQRHFCIGADLAIVDMAEAIALLGDDTPAGGAKAGIETEDDHPSFAITSSETS